MESEGYTILVNNEFGANIEVMDEKGRVEKAKQKKAEQEANRKKAQAERDLKNAEEELARATERVKHLKGK